MSIYCWTLGELALARISKRVYAKVRIAKNEDGIFYDEKVLGMSANEDGSLNITEELCYFVEIQRTKETLWLPYTSLHLAERSRPFYGPADKAPQVLKTNVTPRKRKIKEDHILPMNAVKLAKMNKLDLNTTFDFRQLPIRIGKYENAFKEFIRRGKDMIFDEFYFLLQKDECRIEDWDYITNVDASTEDKFETVIKNIMTEKEVKNYLKSCWRYNFVNKEFDNNNNAVESCSDSSTNASPVKQVITLHAPWCLVCGKPEKLTQCLECPASFHVKCRGLWQTTILHRKSPTIEMSTTTTTVTTTIKKILSSTRTITSKKKQKLPELCPSCMWGPGLGYGDVVWHKLGSCPWWPARVLSPGSLPSCLVSRKHDPQEWPLQYYGTLNYSWGQSSRMCLFLPSHTGALEGGRAEDVKDAVMDANDDYIRIYLT